MLSLEKSGCPAPRGANVTSLSVPLQMSRVHGAWKQKGGLALLIREPLVSRKWLLLLTSAELGFPDVLWRQEVSVALRTVRGVSECP